MDIPFANQTFAGVVADVWNSGDHDAAGQMIESLVAAAIKHGRDTGPVRVHVTQRVGTNPPGSEVIGIRIEHRNH